MIGFESMGNDPARSKTQNRRADGFRQFANERKGVLSRPPRARLESSSR